MKGIRYDFLFICFFAFSAVCFGQLDRASLSGTITDSSGGVVPEARITAVQVSTQATFETVTNGSGVYNFIGLPIGEYAVGAEKSGFKKAVRSGVMLSASSYLNFARKLLLFACKEFFAREKPCGNWDLQEYFFRVSANPYLLLNSKSHDGPRSLSYPVTLRVEK